MLKPEMSNAIIFKLKEEAGYFDASSLGDSELSLVPEDIICLSFENAHITDKGIENLPFLKKIRCIDLDSTQITNKAMETISKFSSLEEVWIEDTKITDVGFKKLALLPNLKYVSFWDTEISGEALNFVMARLPDLESEG